MASGMHQLSSPSRSRHRSRSKSPKRHSKHAAPQPPTKALRTLRIASRSSDEDDVFRLNPGALQNREVQESDGSFFESYTALAWRQENKRLRAASEGDIDADKPPPMEIQYGTKPKFHRLSKKEYELLYIEVLYTVKHKIGVTSGGHSPYQQDLFQYAKEAFSISPEDHATLLARATEEKPPIVILNVTVVGAAGLEAKDADGFSDPYCMLGIMPGSSSSSSQQDNNDSGVVYSSDEDSSPGCSPKTTKEHERRHGSSKRFSLHKRSKDRGSSGSGGSGSSGHGIAVRDHLPARLIRTTLVKPNTLNPVWKEKFRFDLDDVNADTLHLDIWDHDDEFSVIEAAKKLNEVSGLKGLNRFFKQVAQSARSKKSGDVDDFLGCVNIPLENIPSTGIDKWYPLEGRTARSNIQGEINLKLSLATREDRGIPEDDNWTDVRQHEDLMCIFVEHELRKFSDMSYKWTGDLPQVAHTILHQHAIQGDITEVQQAVCRWMAYSRKHMEHPLSYDLLFDLLGDLNRLWEPESLSREEEECLADSFQNFIDYSLSLIRKIRDTFPTNNNIAFSRLEGLLRCLSTIYSSKVFRQCCPFQSELHSEVLAVVKKGNQEWYERLTSTFRSLRKKEEDNLQSLIELCTHVNIEVYRAFHFYNAVFEQWTHVHYFSVMYKQLEKLLSPDVAKSLDDELGEELNQDMASIMKQQDCDREPPELGVSTMGMGTALFELYLSLQEFSGYGKHLSPSEQSQLTISKYYEWFRFTVSRWLHIAQQRAERRIRTAVELEKVAQADAAVKYSTSAVDVCCCFTQMTEFWKQLAWPDKEGAFPFVYRLVETVCQCAKLYADLVHTKLMEKGYYDDEGQFDVTEELCITINNIEQVRRSLKPLPTLLELSEIQQAMDMASALAADLPQLPLSSVIKSADEDMIKKILQVVDRVADKMRPDIKKDVFHLNWAPESLPAEEAIGDLLEYLDSNLLTLNSHLLKTNFDRILASIWKETLEEFNEVMETEEMRPPSFYQRMFDALSLLVDFFYANGKGLEMDDILVDEFQSLRKKLTMHKMDTLALIEGFYLEKSEQQKNATCTEYGILNVRVVYKHESHVLLVEVLSAKDLIPLDANGLSDPYVLVALCPEHVFPNKSVQTTKIIKKTLNPTFDESFEFQVLPSQCRHRGAMLVFTVMDHDLVFQNDFGGEAFLPLADVPGINGEEVSGFDALHVISKPLIHPVLFDDGAMSILRRRTWDTEAQDFVKKRSKIEDLATT
ncbi:LOW QUALITY PROTEIN: BAI1-associated protein 3-like [Babylonia areolata]|uniref:LOW QUALITY PROTEIN: BAI1-associated protein 3-like n=1 Tax=Babylonia areolata TaxID=304850 RepID=UPI003FD3F6EF